MSEINPINSNQLLQLIPDNDVVAFYSDFVRLGIGIKGALMLSVAIRYYKEVGALADWWCKTQKEWMEETGMTLAEIIKAQKRLVEKGYIEVEKRGIPARNFYRLRIERLIDDLRQLGITNE